jgi:hypothetical protein
VSGGAIHGDPGQNILTGDADAGRASRGRPALKRAFQALGVYFRRMCEAGAVDCLQADVSRCGGITEWLRVASVAAAYNLRISGHCAPHLHAHVAAVTPNLRHLEWFHDHVRIESLLFEGTLDQLGNERVRFTPADRAFLSAAVVLSGVRMPRVNSIMERWVQTCRRELLDRTLIWNQRHLLHVLLEFEAFYNGHRPHQGIANARPL